MRLILIYGPPAAGKLTVSTTLAEQTEYRLFHNHLTVVVGRSIFKDSRYPNSNPAYHRLLKQLRLDCVKAAAEANIDLILTLAYSGIPDDPFIAKIVSAVQSHGGEVCFVQLTPPDETLMQRIDNQSRKDLDKLNDPKTLRWLLDTYTMRESVKYPNILMLDTSSINPVEAANRIREHFAINSAKT